MGGRGAEGRIQTHRTVSARCATLPQSRVNAPHAVAATHRVAPRALEGLSAFPSALMGRIIGIRGVGVTAWTPNLIPRLSINGYVGFVLSSNALPLVRELGWSDRPSCNVHPLPWRLTSDVVTLPPILLSTPQNFAGALWQRTYAGATAMSAQRLGSGTRRSLPPAASLRR